ncbi:MAG: ABC transporter permease subunit [Actinomycetales bacterium]|mgnify:CR=1 FL=1|nr:ABC transporter permease subunit [Actinomycetales bacterium]
MTWRLSVRGVRTVAGLELRQRVRSTRWIAVLTIWAVLLGLLTTLIRVAVHLAADIDAIAPGVGGGEAAAGDNVGDQIGRLMFGLIAFLVLSLGTLVAPALSATSINGDRTAGILAPLQTTLLSAAEIAVGKLVAAWTTALALLLTASPFILWTYLEGGTSPLRLLVTLGVLALTLLVVCAIGLGWSSVASRTSSSTVLTYLTIAVLGPGLPILFALCLPTVQQEETVRVRQLVPAGLYLPADSAPRCVESREQLSRTHTERIWWVLAPSPYVVVADAAPRPGDEDTALSGWDPLTLIRDGVREARLGPAEVEDRCGDVATTTRPDGGEDTARERREERNALSAVWPYGLAANLLLGLGFTVTAITRLRAPIRRLPRGVRIG